MHSVAETIGSVIHPWTGRHPADLAPEVNAVDLEQPLGTMSAALEELTPLYLRDAVYFHNPSYAAHLNCPVVIPALVGETILSAVNSSMDTWDQSAGATLIERRLLRWTAERLGLGPAADGAFTSGGTTSNLQALLIARNQAVARLRTTAGSTAESAGTARSEPGSGATADTGSIEATNPRTGTEPADLPEERLPALLSKLRIFASESSHFSIRKSAALLGLGEDAVYPVPCDSKRRLRHDALRQALEESRGRNEIPMAIVATAGTTDFGSIDPLAECAALAAEFGAWLHVDAAYGGGLLTSLKYRDRLSGIEAADSVTVDYHKTFFQPVSASAVLVRNSDELRHIRHYADYLNPQAAAHPDIPNQVDHSIQTTRRFDALKLWLTLRVSGADGIGRLLDSAIDLAQNIGLQLEQASDFELAAPVQLSTAVFRFRPDGLDDDTCDTMNREIRAQLAASGDAVIAGTTLNGRNYLKFTLLNPTATPEDIIHIITLIRRTGSAWLAATEASEVSGVAA
ncbi:pyridoxal-dependent decarboxylase [Arthrobacter sp. Sa2CUA1]|uniref:Pyridoxal-dependent decarboxylase n=1 Tax=Arthrobacter gallicola TaxID=2762225 RepID=A0ABR8UW22_9MICC|nr:pyridoxal-dependent decarboxylase [Arthrobacter gallicola]MBD7996286.1 pyridoxal-dependent decarboxylase [Arthrobacter gallicola]